MPENTQDHKFLSVRSCACLAGPGCGGGLCVSLLMRQNYNAFARMTDFCETRVPAGVREALLPIMSDDEAVKNYGVELGIRMCKTLMEAGAPGQ